MNESQTLGEALRAAREKKRVRIAQVADGDQDTAGTSRSTGGQCAREIPR